MSRWLSGWYWVLHFHSDRVVAIRSSPLCQSGLTVTTRAHNRRARSAKSRPCYSPAFGTISKIFSTHVLCTCTCAYLAMKVFLELVYEYFFLTTLGPNFLLRRSFFVGDLFYFMNCPIKFHILKIFLSSE